MPGPRYEYLLGRSEPPDQLRSGWLVELSGFFNETGYKPTFQADGGIAYERRYSPGFYILLYIILFPLGLLLLLGRPTETLTLTYVQNSAGGTNLTATGTDKRLREFFERLGATDQQRSS